MDTRTGRIYDAETVRRIIGEGADPSRFKELDVPPTRRQMGRRPPRIGRNDLCPCGSGQKFKRCCLRSSP